MMMNELWREAREEGGGRRGGGWNNLDALPFMHTEVPQEPPQAFIKETPSFSGPENSMHILVCKCIGPSQTEAASPPASPP